MSAEKVLVYMIEIFQEYLNYLNDRDETDKDFEFYSGEKTAYVECLEIIQSWEQAKKHGLNFNVEQRYPLPL
ncbi:MAG: hypothetical protein IJY62_06050 [Clostridia bacterium]|nr:hypothetical protein [Clostridia bacterium]